MCCLLGEIPAAPEPALGNADGSWPGTGRCSLCSRTHTELRCHRGVNRKGGGQVPGQWQACLRAALNSWPVPRTAPAGWQAVPRVTQRKDLGRAVLQKSLSSSETVMPVSDEERKAGGRWMSLRPTHQGTSLQCQELASLPGGAEQEGLWGQAAPLPREKGWAVHTAPCCLQEGEPVGVVFPYVLLSLSSHMSPSCRMVQCP